MTVAEMALPERPGTQLEWRGAHVFQSALLAWYDAHRRDLPWRAAPHECADPYRVWLAEIMLQQTTVKAVIPYYDAFLSRWPSLDALAAAPVEDVLAAWAGLGYYSRARNLHACAQEAARLGGFPRTEAALRHLPGIGAYTAAAIAAIAFEQPATVVDGNVERVVSRLFAVETPLPKAKPELKRLAALLTPLERPGDFAQAMMDLGATICSPRSPSCLICPVEEQCTARAAGIAPSLPRRLAKAERPTRHGVAFVAVTDSMEPSILLRRRLNKGLLASMMEAPGSAWLQEQPSDDIVAACQPLRASWLAAAGKITHSFTHFHLELQVYAGHMKEGMLLLEAARPQDCRWAPISGLQGEALPSVMRKVIEHGLKALAIAAPPGLSHANGKAASNASSVSIVERSARPSIKAGRK